MQIDLQYFTIKIFLSVLIFVDAIINKKIFDDENFPIYSINWAASLYSFGHV